MRGEHWDWRGEEGDDGPVEMAQGPLPLPPLPSPHLLVRRRLLLRDLGLEVVGRRLDLQGEGSP